MWARIVSASICGDPDPGSSWTSDAHPAAKAATASSRGFMRWIVPLAREGDHDKGQPRVSHPRSCLPHHRRRFRIRKRTSSPTNTATPRPIPR
jgi:hypothetical protein